VRVHDLPDFAYFNHAVHIKRGVGCASCHGEVDKMPLMWQAGDLTMGWCLDCHRNPGPHIRPADKIVDMNWEPPLEASMQLAAERGVHTLQSCSYCHR
jgi:hypothetical protein